LVSFGPQQFFDGVHGVASIDVVCVNLYSTSRQKQRTDENTGIAAADYEG
jgi:hypothetical protein